jgi:hypothetical protein
MSKRLFAKNLYSFQSVFISLNGLKTLEKLTGTKSVSSGSASSSLPSAAQATVVLSAALFNASIWP